MASRTTPNVCGLAQKTEVECRTSVVVRAAQSEKTEAAFWTFLTAMLHQPALR